MTSEQIEHYNIACNIKYHVLSYISASRASVLLSWSVFGIVDTEANVSHIITIKYGNSVVSGYPVTLSSVQAYQAKYSLILELDLTKVIDIKVEITDSVDSVIKTLRTEPASIDKTILNIEDLSIQETSGSIFNSTEGIHININSCNPLFREKVRGIVIEKSEGTDALVPTFVSSVDIEVPLGILYTDYPYVNIAGTQQVPSSLNFMDIYANREKFLGLIEYSDEFNNYIPDTVTDISTFPPEKIVTVGSVIALNPAIYNDFQSLYYVTLEDKYYRYRPLYSLIPFQFNRDDISKFSKLIKLTEVGENAGYVTLPIDGTISPAGTVNIRTALIASNQDFTGLTSLYFESLPLNTYLPVGTSFMDSFMSHVDTDVTDGIVYNYVVKAYLHNGDSFVLATKSIKKESTAKASGIIPDGLTLDSLRTSIEGNASLSEEDFQSGVSHSGCKVFLSNSSSDYNDYLSYKNLEEDCRCRPQ